LDYHTQDFIDAGNKFSVDYKLLMAIATLESSYGLHVPYGNSYNPFGRKSSSGGYIRFSSWQDAIYNQAEYLKTKYYNLGLDTVDKIGRKYAEDPNWSNKIKKIIDNL